MGRKQVIGVGALAVAAGLVLTLPGAAQACGEKSSVKVACAGKTTTVVCKTITGSGATLAADRIVITDPTSNEALATFVSNDANEHFAWATRTGGDHDMNVTVDGGRIRLRTEPAHDTPWLGIVLSPADEAGLQAGDVITRIGRRSVVGSEESGGLLDDFEIGDRLPLVVQRDGREMRLRARLGEHPGEVEFDLDEGMGAAMGVLEFQSGEGGFLRRHMEMAGEGMHVFRATAGKPRLGVALETLSPQLAEFFGVDEGQGLLVKKVIEDTPAQAAGLKAGDVLLAIDGNDISSVSDVHEALSEAAKGETVRVEVLRRGVRETFLAEMESEPTKTSSLDWTGAHEGNVFIKRVQLGNGEELGGEIAVAIELALDEAGVTMDPAKLHELILEAHGDGDGSTHGVRVIKLKQGGEGNLTWIGSEDGAMAIQPMVMSLHGKGGKIL